MKLVSVCPILKCGKNKNYVNSFRPVTITNNILKLFEILVHNNLNSYVVNHSIVPSNQYGFKAGLSTMHLLVDLIYDLTMGFNDYLILCIDVVFLDFSAAFDNVDFATLLEDLHILGIRGQFIKIIESLLYDREQIVTYNNTKSCKSIVTSGVPQGGICSPLLFNLYVKDIPNVVKFSKVYQYADDTVILKLIYSTNDIDLLQTDINLIHEWNQNNNLKLNPDKSVHLRFTVKRQLDLPLYQINSNIIPTKENHKQLGIILDNKLSFNSHVDCIVDNCFKKWSTLKRICENGNYTVFLRFYK
jgi:hypothetical protein